MEMRHNPFVPNELTSFVGRKRELTETSQLLLSTRLLTITGSAGCGKTRLALRLATNVMQNYCDGVYWVELAQLSNPSFLPQTLAKKLNVIEEPHRSLLDGILDSLQGKQVLLVFDNCELVKNACAQLISTLLALPRLSILTTSREILGILGEMRYPLTPLSLPPADLQVDEVGKYDAIQLFVERARAVLPKFELTHGNAGPVISICRHLDGIPLAIELASAWINVLSVEQIDARLKEQSILLDETNYITTSHYPSLREALDWSYDLLTSLEQALLRRMSVFRGSCSLDVAEAVCGGDGVEREEVLELLSSLVNKSLVVAQTLQEVEARYSLLETVRQYAHEKLITCGELPSVYDRHLKCFLKLAEETEVKLKGKYQQMWLNWLDNEYDNIRAALAWAVEGARLESIRVEAGLRIATCLYQFWRIRDYLEEGLNWYRQLFSLASDEISAIVRANALTYASLMAGLRDQTEDQMRYAEEAVSLGESAGVEGQQVLAYALGAQSYAVRKAGDNLNAFNLGLREIQLLRQVGDKYKLGLCLSINSATAMSIGKFEQARSMLEEAIPLLRKAKDPYRIAMTLNSIGDLERCEQNYRQALTAYEESITILREIGAVRDLASVLHNFGHVCIHLGDIEQAIDLFSESLELHQENANRPGMAECLLGFAALAIISGFPSQGARMLAAMEEIGGRPISSEWAATSMEYKYYLEKVCSVLDNGRFRAEQSRGKRLSLDEAVAYARVIVKKVTTAQQTRRQLELLTPREWEVAVLIAQAKSNTEIAAHLVVSKRTVESHIANIRSKLGLTERTQIVRWAIDNGIVKTNE
jgi:predicted ATPase/DNA-binding CsgD family transcriptional regulator